MLFGNTSQNVTIQPTDGQRIDQIISWTYPDSNPAIFENDSQPTEPPVEIASVEFRLTTDDTILTDPEDSSIEYIRHFHGTSDEPTADYVDPDWVGRTDKTKIPGLPIAQKWYYQARCWSRGGVCSDWTSVVTIVDKPAELPVPEILYIKTNQADQILLHWTDVAANIANFSHYEIVATSVNSDARLNTEWKILGSS